LPLDEEIEQQLEEIGDQLLVDPDDPSFVDIHDMATKWVLKLFKDHPERVPPTLAFKLFLDGTKMRNAQEVPEPEQAEPHSLLDQITALPAEHAAKLIQAEIGRLETELDAHRQALLELEGD
jgi:hypothetical protein